MAKHRAICDRCGLRWWSSDIKRETDTGSRVCPDCVEKMHPQLRPRNRTVADRMYTGFTNPAPSTMIITLTDHNDKPLKFNTGWLDVLHAGGY